MNTVKIIEKHQEVCGIIIEINQVILFVLILNLLNIKQVYREIDTCNVGVGEAGYDANKVGKNKTEVVIPLINCEVEFILTWSKNCVLVNMTEDALVDPAILAPTELKFEITDTKLYVPVVTLSKQNDTTLLEQLKAGFKKTLKWNKYRSQMTIQPKNNNLQ